MFDTKEMQTKFISNMAERLNTMNFRARFREDGDLTVSSSINFLGVVGKTGELYCNSKDLCNPYRRFQLERILQTMDAVRTEMVQANGHDAPAQTKSEIPHQPHLMVGAGASLR